MQLKTLNSLLQGCRQIEAAGLERGSGRRGEKFASPPSTRLSAASSEGHPVQHCSSETAAQHSSLLRMVSPECFALTLARVFWEAHAGQTGTRSSRIWFDRCRQSPWKRRILSPDKTTPMRRHRESASERRRPGRCDRTTMRRKLCQSDQGFLRHLRGQAWQISKTPTVIFCPARGQ